ncbi:MAG: glycosyltransferase family 2 protein, partial [bacterium]
MKKIDIVIPTIKKEFDENIKKQIKEIDSNTDNVNIIVTGLKASAASNRNYGLSKVKSDIVVMMDDDMTGFYPNWLNDLIDIFNIDENCHLVSARLLTTQKTFGHMTGNCNDFTTPYAFVSSKQVPTACIAFKNDETRFDINYIGSGFEDNDFCLQLSDKYPRGTVYISNKCKLIHINEMKNQKGFYWQINHDYF